MGAVQNGGREADRWAVKLLAIAELLLIQWPRGLWLHTRLVLAACLAVLVA